MISIMEFPANVVTGNPSIYIIHRLEALSDRFPLKCSNVVVRLGSSGKPPSR